MDFIEQVGVGPECAEAGLCAEIKRPAAVFQAGKVGRVGFAEDSSAQGDKAMRFVLFGNV